MNISKLAKHGVLLCVATLGILWCSSCTSSKSYPTYTPRTTTTNNNNVVVVKGKRSPWIQRKGSAQVIFQGKNNLLQVMLNKQSITNEGNQVIVIKGNGNTIKIDSADVANARFMRSANGDTLVIMGNQQRFVVKNGQIMVPTNQEDAKTDTLQIKTTPFQRNRYLPDFAEQIAGGHKAHFPYFHGLREIKFAIDYFIMKIEQEQDPESYFELAEMYRLGIGTAKCLKKAIVLYEYAAVQKHRLAIRRLGDLYYRGVTLKKTIFTKSKKDQKTIECSLVHKNHKLAKFFYTQGSQIGDSYCTAMLNELD
ncbi:hypothetical protein BKI52_09215 [marine bacterium AO1-C]|nr:hypothetical protein BKI52_09215 [marine bacterium AO1-C]